jgi:hypothetical protein
MARPKMAVVQHPANPQRKMKTPYELDPAALQNSGTATLADNGRQRGRCHRKSRGAGSSNQSTRWELHAWPILSES